MAKILVVDDEEDLRTFLKMYLEDNGHEVRCAENGAVGYELVKSFRPDIAVVDIIMPLQSGINLYIKIRESRAFKSLPVIILSSVIRFREDFGEKISSLPQPDAFVDKPFDQDKLLQLVEKLIEKS